MQLIARASELIPLEEQPIWGSRQTYVKVCILKIVIKHGYLLQGLILLISGEAYHRGGQSVVGDSWTKSAFEELLFIWTSILFLTISNEISEVIDIWL